MAQVVKNLPTMQDTQEMQVQSLGQEDPLAAQMATHSNILAWRIPWTEEPGELQSMGLQQIQHERVHMGMCILKEVERPLSRKIHNYLSVGESSQCICRPAWGMTQIPLRLIKLGRPAHLKAYNTHQSSWAPPECTASHYCCRLNVLQRNWASTRQICRAQTPGIAAIMVNPSQENSQRARKDYWAVANPKASLVTQR